MPRFYDEDTHKHTFTCSMCDATHTGQPLDYRTPPGWKQAEPDVFVCPDCIAKEEKEEWKSILEEPGIEPTNNRPDYYREGPCSCDDFQEFLFMKVVEDDPKAALWLAFSAKHMYRIGGKDHWRTEAIKARNYLNKAIEGEWLED